MKIVHDYPPNFEELRTHFAIEPGAPVAFCYGDTIYNPNGVELREDLIFHESVHSRQQGRDPDGWYRKYMDDPTFRIGQEIEAYGQQLRFIKRTIGAKQCLQALDSFVTFLASPVYAVPGVETRYALMEYLRKPES